jgi:hypothetical protein
LLKIELWFDLDAGALFLGGYGDWLGQVFSGLWWTMGDLPWPDLV